MYSSARTVSTASVMMSRHSEVGTFGALAISSDSASTSDSPRWRKISPARSSPIATSRAAAFCTPLILSTVISRVASLAGTGLVLRHPLLDLRGHARRLALHQLIERVQARVGHARGQCDRGRLGRDHRLRALLELGQRDGLLDLGEPARLGQRLAL